MPTAGAGRIRQFDHKVRVTSVKETPNDCEAFAGMRVWIPDDDFKPLLLGQYVAGSKGTMSEMELSILRRRAHEALKQKARHGELFASVAIGYVRSGPDRIEPDPDLRVREALALVFRKFVELQSVRQVHLWFRQETIALPAVRHGPEGRRLRGKPPV